jgi:hypothetical protein
MCNELNDEARRDDPIKSAQDVEAVEAEAAAASITTARLRQLATRG